MKILQISKDGGKKSKVWGWFVCEFKPLFSIVLLHFHSGSREAYHSHAFNAVSWISYGRLKEQVIDGSEQILKPSIWPVFTSRERFHKVFSHGHTWALSFRGPWANTWKERYDDEGGREVTLTHGRIEV